MLLPHPVTAGHRLAQGCHGLRPQMTKLMVKPGTGLRRAGTHPSEGAAQGETFLPQGPGKTCLCRRSCSRGPEPEKGGGRRKLRHWDYGKRQRPPRQAKLLELPCSSPLFSRRWFSWKAKTELGVKTFYKPELRGIHWQSLTSGGAVPAQFG